ncbi:hypothetical protein BU23DRAFT_548738 [Bimuria novae-zelandiae CBS 107.79]|uniref:Uncharacterized protein n=1 Tax=Bimuria novae-zelandiae CBS 107.79 TaxID=1447943 RepID=A0A6A5VQJ8_9PLEO|nr:hypothetical protein BU23DRAFT_548738 [Bimuria novae-zelandiae CBS 107.79]
MASPQHTSRFPSVSVDHVCGRAVRKCANAVRSGRGATLLDCCSATAIPPPLPYHPRHTQRILRFVSLCNLLTSHFYVPDLQLPRSQDDGAASKI